MGLVRASIWSLAEMPPVSCWWTPEPAVPGLFLTIDWPTRAADRVVAPSDDAVETVLVESISGWLFRRMRFPMSANDADAVAAGIYLAPA